jgi:multiple antibiotic resistance protein
MNVAIHSFIQLVFIGIIALFPVINPIGSAFIVSPYFDGLTEKERRNVVKKIAFYVFVLCTITLFTGHWILELFGITVPIIQLAGGIMICKLGWGLLSSDGDTKPGARNESAAVSDHILKDIDNKIFYPITFPITAGAGTISVIFTLSAHATHLDATQFLINEGAILLAIIFMSLLVYICYFNANRLVNYLGSSSEQVVNRLMAFLIFCVGLQIAVGGITKLVKAYTPAGPLPAF